MRVQCQKCLPEEGIEIPNFTQADKQQLCELKLASSMHTIKLLVDEFQLSHRDAKYIALHINIHGKCHHCNNEILVGEYTTCPRCKRLNFNWAVDESKAPTI